MSPLRARSVWTLLVLVAFATCLSPGDALARKRKKKRKKAPVEVVAPAPPIVEAPTPAPSAAAPGPTVKELTAPAPSLDTPAAAADRLPPGAPPGASEGGGGNGSLFADPSSGTGTLFNPTPSPSKAGRFMVNLRIGPAFDLSQGANQFALMPEFAVAVLAGYKGYLIVPLAFQFGGGLTSIIIPVGFQYDFELPIKNLPGLYLTPRISLGFGTVVFNQLSGSGSTSFGALTPELGAKYVYRKRWNFGADLISIPVLFGASYGTIAWWRFQFYAGVNF